MGYYINPLIAVLFGVVIFKEKLIPLKITALILAAGGILVQTFFYGKIPWISITLAVSFTIYGVLKKLMHLEAEVGIAMETLLISPFALGYI